ncbi:MAG: hypothetical protein HY355_02965 [Armatimonadetes bacterium]|nr:hypothetical protein [Armatimonadota bacterium]
MRAWLAARFSERTWLFLLSLGIAIAMWFYVGTTTAPPDQATASLLARNVDVIIVGLARGWTVTVDPAAVDVEMRGPATILTARSTDVRAIADVSALVPGVHQVTLRIQFPRGVTTVRATPPAVQVTLVRP